MKKAIKLLSVFLLLGFLISGCAGSRKGGCACPGTKGMTGF